MYLLRNPDHALVPDTDLFTASNRPERRNISRLGTAVRVDSGTTLTSEGRSGREFFVVRDGEAVCTVRGTRRAQFRSGDFFGEMALLDGGPRTATVTAETTMNLVVYSLPEFRTMLDTSPSVRKHLLVAMSQRLRVADSAVSKSA